MKVIEVENYICLVGQNAKENWSLLTNAKQKHIFFHLSSFPSCYVILQTDEKVNDDIIAQCARICLENTKYKNMCDVYVDYTPVSNTKKGDVVGEVVYKSMRKVSKIKL